MAHTTVRRHRRKGNPVRAHRRKTQGAKGELKFFDLGSKKTFSTSNYKIVVKSGRRFAVAKNPSGKTSYRIVGKDVK